MGAGELSESESQRVSESERDREWERSFENEGDLSALRILAALAAETMMKRE